MNYSFMPNYSKNYYCYLPRSQTTINVEFTSRFLHPAEAVLLLISKRMGGIGGATLTFSLKSEVKHIEPAVSLCVKLLLSQKILFRCMLYQSKWPEVRIKRWVTISINLWSINAQVSNFSLCICREMPRGIFEICKGVNLTEISNKF